MANFEKNFHILSKNDARDFANRYITNNIKNHVIIDSYVNNNSSNDQTQNLVSQNENIKNSSHEKNDFSFNLNDDSINNDSRNQNYFDTNSQENNFDNFLYENNDDIHKFIKELEAAEFHDEEEDNSSDETDNIYNLFEKFNLDKKILSNKQNDEIDILNHLSRSRIQEILVEKFGYCNDLLLDELHSNSISHNWKELDLQKWLLDPRNQKLIDQADSKQKIIHNQLQVQETKNEEVANNTKSNNQDSYFGKMVEEKLTSFINEMTEKMNLYNENNKNLQTSINAIKNELEETKKQNLNTNNTLLNQENNRNNSLSNSFNDFALNNKIDTLSWKIENFDKNIKNTIIEENYRKLQFDNQVEVLKNHFNEKVSFLANLNLNGTSIKPIESSSNSLCNIVNELKSEMKNKFDEIEGKINDIKTETHEEKLKKGIKNIFNSDFSLNDNNLEFFEKKNDDAFDKRKNVNIVELEEEIDEDQETPINLNFKVDDCIDEIEKDFIKQEAKEEKKDEPIKQTFQALDVNVYDILEEFDNMSFEKNNLKENEEEHKENISLDFSNLEFNPQAKNLVKSEPSKKSIDLSKIEKNIKMLSAIDDVEDDDEDDDEIVFETIKKIEKPTNDKKSDKLTTIKTESKEANLFESQKDKKIVLSDNVLKIDSNPIFSETEINPYYLQENSIQKKDVNNPSQKYSNSIVDITDLEETLPKQLERIVEEKIVDQSGVNQLIEEGAEIVIENITEETKIVETKQEIVIEKEIETKQLNNGEVTDEKIEAFSSNNDKPLNDDKNVKKVIDSADEVFVLEAKRMINHEQMTKNLINVERLDFDKLPSYEIVEEKMNKNNEDNLIKSTNNDYNKLLDTNNIENFVNEQKQEVKIEEIVDFSDKNNEKNTEKQTNNEEKEKLSVSSAVENDEKALEMQAKAKKDEEELVFLKEKNLKIKDIIDSTVWEIDDIVKDLDQLNVVDETINNVKNLKDKFKRI